MASGWWYVNYGASDTLDEQGHLMAYGNTNGIKLQICSKSK